MSARFFRIPLWSIGLWRIPGLAVLLGQKPCLALHPWVQGDGVAWMGWGGKRSARFTRVFARFNGRTVVRVEDGFLRSLGTGRHFPALSFVMDDAGIYYDATRSSSLENLLNSNVDVLHGIVGDVARAKSLVLAHRLSKYNHAPDWKRPTTEKGAGRSSTARQILVVDQTNGDMSVSLGGANVDTFTAMLAAARAENLGATIYVKTHPELSAGRKGGYLTNVHDDEHTVVLRHSINPLSLIEQMDRIYVVTSTMGFEALLAGKPVTCFGLPWYSGWGVTDDRQACPRRTRQRTVDELFAAAYFHYTRYLNPVTHQRGTIFDVLDWLLLQRRTTNRFGMQPDQRRMIGVGFRRWKAVNIKPLMALNPKQVTFAPTVEAAKQLKPSTADHLFVWGATPPARLAELSQMTSARIMHIEDGFIRSVGLGSDLIRPLSLVLDERGIYFDPTRPSDLEHMLNTELFSATELVRARAVRKFIVEHGITKYNLEPRKTAQWQSGGRLVVLVPGQVEDDASIRLGCTEIKTNLGLLQAVRIAQPDAYIVYKPHPDVMSGNRSGKLKLDQAAVWADHIETQLSVVNCIEACEEVHTMTSLTGFDALLRDKKVVTYGQPFYAGWGLTEDRVKDGVAYLRRNRRLNIDELVAGALLRYPIYWDWELKGYTTCEAVLYRIVESRNALEANGGLQKLRTGYWRRQWRKLTVLARVWGAWA